MNHNNFKLSDFFFTLDSLRHDGILDVTDHSFAHWLHTRLGEKHPAVLLAAAYLSNLARNGHVGCPIPLPAGIKKLLKLDTISEITPELLESGHSEMAEAVRNSGCVGRVSDPKHPLIFDRNFLYFHRYWMYEYSLSVWFSQKAIQPHFEIDPAQPVHYIEMLFEDTPRKDTPQWQKLALWMALQRKLLILTGGPGTGKTYTLIRLVAIQLLLHSDAGDPPPRVALAAPTGKAAARINESIRKNTTALNGVLSDKLFAHLPMEAQTLHRLLGTRRYKTEFRHHADNPLPHDIVVVDEASMVDIGLMTKLTEALKPDAQLILIGDKDQLASVDAGSVLGDLCSPAENVPVNLFTESFCSRVETAGLIPPPSDLPLSTRPLTDCIVQLEENYRYGEDSELGNLARFVNGNQPEKALNLLKNGQNITLITSSPYQTLIEEFNAWPFTRFDMAKTHSHELFEAWRSFQILCAHRHGPQGIHQINGILDRHMQKLRQKTDIPVNKDWYPGRPIMITTNDYELNLFNGDIGITVPHPDQPGQLAVCFESNNPDEGKSQFRYLSPALLARYESCWAITVHKSQGSEFKNVALLLPEQVTPVITRELIYTALTRSRKRFNLYATPQIFKKAIGQSVFRSGALQERLWNP